MMSPYATWPSRFANVHRSISNNDSSHLKPVRKHRLSKYALKNPLSQCCIYKVGVTGNPSGVRCTSRCLLLRCITLCCVVGFRLLVAGCCLLLVGLLNCKNTTWFYVRLRLSTQFRVYLSPTVLSHDGQPLIILLIWHRYLLSFWIMTQHTYPLPICTMTTLFKLANFCMLYAHNCIRSQHCYALL